MPSRFSSSSQQTSSRSQPLTGAWDARHGSQQPGYPVSALPPLTSQGHHRRPSHTYAFADPSLRQASSLGSQPSAHPNLSQALPTTTLLPSFATTRRLPLPLSSTPSSYTSDPRGFSYSKQDPLPSMSAAAFAYSHIQAPSYAVQPSSGWAARPLERRRSQSMSAGGSSTSSGTGGSYTGGQKSDPSSISSFTSMSSAGSALSRAGSHGSWRSTSSGGSTGSMKTWDGAYGAGVVYGGLEGGAPDHGGAPLYSSFSALPTYTPPFSQLPSSSCSPVQRLPHPARSTSTLHASPIPPTPTPSSPTEDSKRSKRANFTSAEVERLQATWDRELYYPSMELVAGIMQETGLTRVQIRNWFASRRQRATGDEKRRIAEQGKQLPAGGAC